MHVGTACVWMHLVELLTQSIAGCIQLRLPVTDAPCRTTYAVHRRGMLAAPEAEPWETTEAGVAWGSGAGTLDLQGGHLNGTFKDASARHDSISDATKLQWAPRTLCYRMRQLPSLKMTSKGTYSHSAAQACRRCLCLDAPCRTTYAVHRRVHPASAAGYGCAL
jgi:hypothetical protein